MGSEKKGSIHAPSQVLMKAPCLLGLLETVTAAHIGSSKASRPVSAIIVVDSYSCAVYCRGPKHFPSLSLSIYIHIYWSHIPNMATVSSTSDIPQNEVHGVVLEAFLVCSP